MEVIGRARRAFADTTSTLINFVMVVGLMIAIVRITPAIADAIFLFTTYLR